MKHSSMSKILLASLVLSPISMVGYGVSAFAAGSAQLPGGADSITLPVGSTIQVNAAGTDYTSGTVTSSVYGSVSSSVYGSSSAATEQANVTNGNFSVNVPLPGASGQYNINLSQQGHDDVPVAGSVYLTDGSLATVALDVYGEAQINFDSNKTIAAINTAAAANTNLFVLGAPAVPNATSLAVSLNSDVVDAAVKKGGSNAVLALVTQYGNYYLPVNALTLANNSKVVVNIIPQDAKTSDVATAVYAAKDLSLVGTPVSFGVWTVAADGSSTNVDNFGNTYVAASVYASGVDPNKSVAVTLGADGTLVPLPTYFVTQADGKTVAFVSHTGNGTYALVTGNKTFSDIQGQWFQFDIEKMASHLIVKGESETAFAPADNVTRAQFAALLVRALGLTDRTGAGSFTDVKSADWFQHDVNVAASIGLVKGYDDGSFKPNDQISREDAAVMIIRAMAFTGKQAPSTGDLSQFKDAGDIQSYAKTALGASVQAGILKGDGSNAKPLANATRAEAAVMIERLMNNLKFLN